VSLVLHVPVSSLVYSNPQENTLQFVIVGTVSTFNTLEPPSSTCTTSFTLSVGKILVFSQHARRAGSKSLCGD
jgi:hypothetical protein